MQMQNVIAGGHMTKDEINRTIHEAMGLCWHDPKIYIKPTIPGNSFYRCCPVCGIGYRENPDYTSPNGFFACWNWAKEQDFWDDFEVWYWNMLRNTGIMDYDFRMSDYLKHLINTETFAPRLAMFIKRKNK